MLLRLTLLPLVTPLCVAACAVPTPPAEESGRTAQAAGVNCTQDPTPDKPHCPKCALVDEESVTISDIPATGEPIRVFFDPPAAPTSESGIGATTIHVAVACPELPEAVWLAPGERRLARHDFRLPEWMRSLPPGMKLDVASPDARDDWGPR